MDKLLDCIMKYLYQNDRDLDDGQAEVIRYGLEITLLKVIFLVSILLAGILINSFWECLTFIIFFIPLRSYAGGYHAKTRIQCFIQSMLTVVIVIVTLKIMNMYITLLLLIAALVSSPFIWILSPVDTENKRLGAEDRKAFRKKTRIVLVIEIIAAAVFWFADLKIITYASMLSIIDVVLLQSIEYEKNKKAEKTNG